MSNCLNKPELKAFVATWYLEGGMPPREILQKLETDHGVTVSSNTLRQWLVRTGLTAKRKQIDASLNDALAPEKVAVTRQEKAQEHLDRWTGQAVTVVDKAIGAAVEAKSLRDLSTATATAAQAVRLFQMTSGAIGTPGPRSTINVNFATSLESPFHPENRARSAAKKEAERQAAISISVTEVPGSSEVL